MRPCSTVACLCVVCAGGFFRCVCPVSQCGLRQQLSGHSLSMSAKELPQQREQHSLRACQCKAPHTSCAFPPVSAFVCWFCQTVSMYPTCRRFCRRYYQPPSAHERQIPGLTGRQGRPLWMVLTLLLTIVGSSLGVAFGWATGRHWALYAVFGGKVPPGQPTGQLAFSHAN